MPDEKTISIVLAEPQPVFRIGLRKVLEADSRLTIVGEAADGEQAIRMARDHHADVLLTEYFLPKMTGLQVLEAVSGLEGVHVLFVTSGIPRPQVLDALRKGLRGVIDKQADPRTFSKAIRCVFNGEVWVERDVLTDWARTSAQPTDHFGLTLRELEIVREILGGGSNKDIAAKLQLSEDTVKRHLTNTFRKLGVNSRLELSLFAMHHRLIA